MNRLKEKYFKEVVPSLKEKYHYTTLMAVPKIEKIVINMGVGDAKENSKFLEGAVKDLELITGAKPVVTKARKSIAGFKIREGAPIGCKVTLRGENMYVFLEKLIRISLPRVGASTGQHSQDEAHGPKSGAGKGTARRGGLREQAGRT